jgi:hypothetical protein
MGGLVGMGVGVRVLSTQRPGVLFKEGIQGVVIAPVVGLGVVMPSPEGRHSQAG